MIFPTWILFFTWLAYLVNRTTSNEDYELILVQMLFRHGERAPIALYPTDPNPESFWKEGLGELTLLGEKQHYGLGKFLRYMYRNFMTGNSREIKVISSSYNRCILSAMSNLAGFYPPDDDSKIDKNLNWQPIPVHYIPDLIDKYMDTDSFCPRATVELKRIENSPAAKKFLADHKEMFQNLTYYSGMPITDCLSSLLFHDCILQEKRYNLTIPDWVEPYWDELTRISNAAFYWAFNSPLMQRLRAGPLLKKIRDLVLKKISGDLPGQKFQMYSSHDANIAVILEAYDLYPKSVPFAATLIFELYSSPDSSHFVRLVYLNSTEPENIFQTPHVLKFPGCEEYCPLHYFINITEPFIPLFWETECLSPIY
ncbi:lysosomal acid phosphatase-like isoform X1 [Parasteatoda tepidariorum]|uniref:lysosomal acid phosphatase-like isoform X1 n=1 Tax=Parasteatoda tepidariorum TaxID=114398 RepID=UPI0039BC4A32